MDIAAKESNEGRPHMELRCQVDTSLLGLLRDFVCSVARHIGFTETHVAEIEIAVDEACANAMEHAYIQSTGPPPQHHDVLVELFLDPDHLTIRITDHGSGVQNFDNPEFNIEDYLEPTRQAYRGLGIHLMHKFMDEVHIDSAPERGTTIIMTKRRK